MTNDPFLWAYTVGALAALAGMLTGLALHKRLEKTWLQTTRGGEYLTICLWMTLFVAAGLATTLTLKAVGIAAVYFVMVLGARRPRSHRTTT